MKILITLFLIVTSAPIYAESPQEIQGVWTPNIEKSIVLFEKNMPEMDADFMRENYLPKLERTITKNRYIHMTV